jgi:hypothetical protein
LSKPVPLQYDRYYHICNRGNNRENLFVEDRNYRHFLKLYARYVAPVADTYAYCLLKNHFHVLVRIKTVAEQGHTGTIRIPSQQFGLFSTPTPRRSTRPMGAVGVSLNTHLSGLRSRQNSICGGSTPTSTTTRKSTA